MNIIPVNRTGAILNGSTFNSDDLIEQYLADVQEVMAGTKRRYKKSLKRYFDWLERMNYNVRQVTLTEILQYKKYLQEEKTEDGTLLSTITVGGYLVVVRGFYTWANSKGFPYNPAASLKSPKRDAKFGKDPIPEKEMAQLFDYFQKTSLRDLAIAKTLYFCGFRCMELSATNFGDITTVDGVKVVWVRGKGKKAKEEWVKPKQEAFDAIDAYVSSRPKQDGQLYFSKDSAIFVSDSPVNPGTRLTPESISRIIRKGLDAIGLTDRKYSAHSLRHSAGTNAIDRGATLEDVRAMLRHASTTTTQGYAKFALDRARLKKSAEDLL